tara:strand:- start:415 stop:633 length:219 start_codon:yes stop_codon:yes gene_type:complete
MSFLAPKMPSLPPVPVPVAIPEPTVSSEDKERIASEQAAIARKRRGRSSTILTGPLGDVTESEIEKKTLLGS